MQRCFQSSSPLSSRAHLLTERLEYPNQLSLHLSRNTLATTMEAHWLLKLVLPSIDCDGNLMGNLKYGCKINLYTVYYMGHL